MNQSGGACTEAPCVLGRINAASSAAAAAPVVEYVQPGGLSFRYFTSGGAEINPASPGTYTQADIALVKITLQITKGTASQNLTTSVKLRNPG